ncbi:MAG: hypothetical protein EAZ07_02485 [Cytophagales bacterium]|nr:MAG: hypothetical protein EAZ07_02485 [Cytophagales bacterium]
MLRKIYVVYLGLSVFLYAQNISAQIGGNSSFNFLRMPSNAPLIAVGGMNVSVRSIHMIGQNPALINKEMNKNLLISNQQYYAGINTTALTYVHNFNKIGPLALNLYYFTSGKIKQTDATGNETGSFSANQYYISIGKSHTINYYSLGLNLKIAGSNVAGYNSFASLADIGGVFKHPTKDFTVGLVLQNIGFTFNNYTSVEQSLPFDVQLGTSYKLEHMPFRFSILAHHLHTFDIVYLDPNKKQPLDANGEPIVEKKSTGDKILRHFNLGGEFFLGKFISLKVGYNHLVRREMRTEVRSGMAGFSFGVLVNVKSFEFSYSRDWQHVAGGFNCLSLKVNFSELLSKKTNLPFRSTN